jgi:hypothetical protein
MVYTNNIKIKLINWKKIILKIEKSILKMIKMAYGLPLSGRL